MHEFTVTLTEAEYKALAHATLSPQDWISSTVHERCRYEMDAIFQSEVQRMLADPNIKEIPADREAVVLAADIKTGAERNAEISERHEMENDNGV